MPSNEWFGVRRFLKDFSLWLSWELEFFIEHNYLKNIERGSPKEHSCETWLKIQSTVSEEKFFKEKAYGRKHGRTNGLADARRTTVWQFLACLRPAK